MNFANIEAIRAAKTADLVAFYNANAPEGDQVKKFRDRATTEQKAIVILEAKAGSEKVRVRLRFACYPFQKDAGRGVRTVTTRAFHLSGVDNWSILSRAMTSRWMAWAPRNQLFEHFVKRGHPVRSL